MQQYNNVIPNNSVFVDNELALGAWNNSSKFRTRNWVEINDSQEEHILVMILNLKLQY